VPASELAREHLGRPLPGAPLLGGFAGLSGLISIDSVAEAIRDKFSGAVADGNVAAARAAFDLVREEMKELTSA
jgi:pyruvate ferredoxin oxidoreductase gamma subunit